MTAAETIMMVKERIAEVYGPIRYTISTGCSGGSMMQTSPASIMPGLLNGLQPTCSYPDAPSTWIETTDCGLLRGHYFLTPKLQHVGRILHQPAASKCCRQLWIGVSSRDRV
ncbi:MAG: hypothetical protein E6H69_13065 [Betaproteobacteria bacterium]|nr:MAG: hypothetical protein E6H69_13065 [Betaproteobacteria bacterium]